MGNLFSVCGVYNNGSYGILPFGGFILRDEPQEKRKTFEGKIADYFGLADVNGAFAEENKIHFEKTYQSGSKMNYRLEFDKEKGMWLGEFESTISKTNGRVIFRISPFLESLVLNIDKTYTSSEEWAENLVKEMLDDGYLVQSKDSEGRNIILPGKDQNENKEDDILF